MRRVCTLLLVALSVLAMSADKPPWRARKRPGFLPNRLAAACVGPEDFPPEPGAPESVEAERFTRALAELCVWPRASRAGRLASHILAAAAEFAIDPFLLGALVYRASRCRADKEDELGVGLTLLPQRMYRGSFRGRAYHYQVREDGRWVARSKPMPRFAFVPGTLRRAEPNLYFAAGLLAVWREQHETVDREFEQVPHRHFISHFVWGDRVRSARAEDRIFTDRRRLLGYYGALPSPAPIQYRGLALGPPLDGAPRVVSSGLGFAREGGRSHRGVDVESEFGEPVRAIADGKVVFSGVDLPGQRNHAQLAPAETNAYDRKLLGHGGRYVCIAHAVEDAALRSCAMHLETVEVRYGDAVTRGQRIGRVGRTGMKRSAPHLHLELFSDRELLDPLEVLRGHLIGAPVEWKDLERAGPASASAGSADF